MSRVGPVAAAALIAASMIGTGVFTTSGFALADLGSREAVLVAWALGGLYALAGALSYGWLVLRFPTNGGEAALLAATWHPTLGAASGWMGLAAGFTAPIAAAALALDAYLGRPGLGLAAIAAAAVVHAIGGVGAVAQTAAVGLKVALLLAGLALGATALPPLADPTSLAGASWSRLGPTVVWVAFAYSGWNAVAYLGADLSPAARRPRVALGAVLGVAATYLGVNAITLYAAPVSALAGRPDVAVAAVEALGVPALVAGVRPVVGLALLTSILAMVWTGAAVWQHLARVGGWPGPVGRWVARWPVAVGAQAAAGIAAARWAGLRDLLGYVGLTLAISAALTVAGLFAWQRRTGERPDSALYPWVPAAFIAATAAGAGWMAWREPGPALASALTLAAALGLAAATTRRAA